MRKIVAIALLAVPVLAACGKGKESKILAVVDGQRITAESFRKEAESLPPYIKPLLDTPDGQLQLLEGMVSRDLLMREALRRGIDRRADVREKVEMARRSILLDALLKDVTEKAAGDDATMRKYYEENKDSFQVGERVKVSHLLFRDQETAASFAARAKGGAPFEVLMKEARAEGGTSADLGFIEKGRFVKEFEAAAFGASVGTITGPVKTPYGFHVIKVDERRPAGVKSFDEVKLQLLAESREKVQRQAFDTLLTGLKKNSRIQYFVKAAGEGEGPVMVPRGEKGAPAPAAGAAPPAPAGKGPEAPAGAAPPAPAGKAPAPPAGK
jgi:peptidyl-prolyl cis-trans isomerase C